jgi:hypothetical protein
MAAPLRRVLRWLKWPLIVLGVMVLAAAIAITRNEVSCQVAPAAGANAYKPLLNAAHRRDEVNSYLTYPEWAIVHAYEDLAGVMRRSGESDFAYFASVSGFWSSLCDLTRLASSRGPISLEYKVTLYTIGLSFAAEMGVKGLYERTIGRLTAWLRGPTRTPEDTFALAVADDYAKFLRQTPWYEYPFGPKLRQFWRETPFTFASPVRSIERRFALTLEYGSKALYAKLIGFGAGAIPAELKIRSVVRNAEPADLAADPRIAVIGTIDGGGTVIETPRYRVFTEILLGLAARGRDIAEIAGNDDILITVLARDDAAAAKINGKRLFVVPVQSRPGWSRIGVDVKVADLLSVVRRLKGTGAELEHVYDY